MVVEGSSGGRLEDGLVPKKASPLIVGDRHPPLNGKAFGTFARGAKPASVRCPVKISSPPHINTVL